MRTSTIIFITIAILGFTQAQNADACADGLKLLINDAKQLAADLRKRISRHEAHPEERGYYWASRFTDVAKVFGYMPDDLYANADKTREGEVIEDLETFQIIDTIEVINKQTARCLVMSDSLEMFELNNHSTFRFGGTFSNMTNEGKYLATSEGIIYDLSKDNIVYLDSEMRGTTAHFFDNDEKVWV